MSELGGGRHETGAERADRNWAELLQELRVSQTGVQLLTAFLLSLPLQQRFTSLSSGQHLTYLVAVCLSVIATGLLVAPVAVHRAVFQRHEKAELVKVGDRAARAGLLLPSLGRLRRRGADLQHRRRTLGAALSGLTCVTLLAVLWWWLPLRIAARQR